ncbi:hypothetical protein OTU49_015433 [Cherax quadricarinatus]|uniref:Uncharacterized protein n=1 Tax=Cherax quadricarinatus TaxID=27406 RepID=A0AAW0YCY9_CHEQU
MARYYIFLVAFFYCVLLFVNEHTRSRKWELINAIRSRHRHELSQGLNINVTSFVGAQTDSTEAVWAKVPFVNTILTLVRNCIWTEWLMAETREALSCFSPWTVRGYLLTGVLSVVLVVAFTVPNIVLFITWLDKSLNTRNKLTSADEDEYKDPSADIDDVYVDPSAEIDDVYEDPSAEIDDVYEDPSAEIDDVYEDPSAEIDDVYEDPSAEIDDVYEDPSAEIDDVYEDPSAEIDDVYEDPSAEIDDVYEDPSAEIDDVYEDPSAEIDDVYEDPSAEIDDVYEDPSAEIDDVYEDPSAEIDDVYEDPSGDVDNFNAVPSVSFVVVFQDDIFGLKHLLNSFEEDLEEFMSLSVKYLSVPSFSEARDYTGSCLDFIKDTKLFIAKCTKFVENPEGLPCEDNGRVMNVQYARGGTGYVLLFDV